MRLRAWTDVKSDWWPDYFEGHEALQSGEHESFRPSPKPTHVHATFHPMITSSLHVIHLLRETAKYCTSLQSPGRSIYHRQKIVCRLFSRCWNLAAGDGNIFTTLLCKQIINTDNSIVSTLTASEDFHRLRRRVGAGASGTGGKLRYRSHQRPGQSQNLVINIKWHPVSAFSVIIGGRISSLKLLCSGFRSDTENSLLLEEGGC